MGFELNVFGDEQLLEEFMEWLVDERAVEVQKHFGRLWSYYSNPMRDVGRGASEKIKENGQCYLQAQEYGLPSRITGVSYPSGGGVWNGRAVKDVQRKEVVIENDIGWRVNAGVDFLFGKPISFVSRSPEARKRAEIEKIIKALFSANGGVGFFQDMAVLGGVYGFVDCIIRPGAEVVKSASGPHRNNSFERVLQLARAIDLELVDAPRALPILEEGDYRKVRCYVQHFYQQKNSVSRSGSFLSRLLSQRYNHQRSGSYVTEILTSGAWQRYEDKQLTGEGIVPWGFVPVVHIQNIAQPFFYEGLSEVEPLIPLQDELNTRLSDRASRITFQSFKMYLGKGIEGFADRPVSPGRMWYTDNPEACIEEFGGDDKTPSEDMHIGEIREAIDKVSGVTPLVAGLLKNKVGNLTSAVALRLTLMGILSKTEKKRFTYGGGIKRLCRQVLEILDKAEVYQTDEADRELEIIFPSPLPENMMEKLKEAQIKKELGVPAVQVLRELGYEQQLIEEQG